MVSNDDSTRRADTDEEMEVSGVLQREVRGEQQYDPEKDSTAGSPGEPTKPQGDGNDDDYPQQGTGIADV
jgi:hypothetical protein